MGRRTCWASNRIRPLISMKIFTKLQHQWDGSRYRLIESESYEHTGPIVLCCGASNAQTSALNTQTGLTQQIIQQGQEVFGNSSGVFNDLVSSLAPTVAAGPNQQGFSAAENSALQSSAITNAGIAYKNAKSATGDAMAAENGGNTDLPSGTTAGVDANLASSASQNTANQLNTIAQQNYATGRQNYDTAVSGLESAPGVFNTANGYNKSGVKSGEAEADTANQIASQNNSWIQGVTGALGTVAGAAAKG